MGKQANKLDERYPDPPEAEKTGAPMLDQLESQLDRPAVVLTRRQVNDLGSILGRNVLTPADLLAACERLTTCNVEGVDIRIEPGVLLRLKSRAMRQAFTDYLRVTVTRLLHGEVGW